MSMSIKKLVANSQIVAMTFKRKLEPIDGWDVPIFPPTYPAPESRPHRFDTPYTVNETKNGVRTSDLDSVQSQANRMEAAFTGDLADCIPQHAVRAGEGSPVPLTKLPHRVVDASIRATDFAARIRDAMLAVESGNAVPLAKIAPTSLVYGAWDSRDTQVRLPRAVRSEIRAWDVSVFTRSAQYSGAFSQESLGIEDTDWNRKKGGAASVGFAPTPEVDAPGGILVHGEIVHSASVLLNVLRKYRTGDDSDVLPAYLLGLALGGLLAGEGDYNLRSGCFLVPAAPVEWQTVARDGERQSVELDASAVFEELREAADEWADAAEAVLGGEPESHTYDPSAAKSMFAAASKAR